MAIALPNGSAVTFIDEVLLASNITYAALIKRVQRGVENPLGMKKVNRSCKGNPAMIDYDSLPPPVRERIPDPRFEGHILERYFRVIPEHRTFYSDYRKADGNGLSQENISQYSLNANVAAAVLQLYDERVKKRISMGGKIRDVWRTVRADAASFQEVLLHRYNRKHTIPMSIFKSKIEAFKTKGCEVFIKDKASKSQKNAKKVKYREQELLLALITKLGYRTTAKELHSYYERFRCGLVELAVDGEILDPKDDYPELSLRTVQGFRNRFCVKSAVDAEMPEDRQKNITRYVPSQSYNRPQYSGSVVSVDDRQPPFLYRTASGATQRAWFYLGIDLHSEVFLAAVDGRDKQGLIRKFYTQLVENSDHYFGGNMPAEIECESSLNSELVREGMLQDGVVFDHVTMHANNARAKRIERYFRDLRYGIERKVRGFKARHYGKTEMNRMMEKEAYVFESYDALVSQVYTGIDEWNRSAHSVDGDKTRLEILQANQAPNRRSPHWKEVLSYAGRRSVVTMRGGVWHFGQTRWLPGFGKEYALGDDLENILLKVWEKKVEVFYLKDAQTDEVKRAQAYVGGSYVCDLVHQDQVQRAKVERGERDKVNQGRFFKYYQSLNAIIKKFRAGIPGSLVLTDGHLAEPLQGDGKVGAYGLRFNSGLGDTWGEKNKDIPDPKEVLKKKDKGQRVKDKEGFDWWNAVQ